MLFLDLLGVRAMNRGSGLRYAARLVELDLAIAGQYRHYFRPESPWPSAFFSDTLVLAAPIVEPDDEATARRGLVLQAAWLQMALSWK